MASNIVEFFGYAPQDDSPAAKEARRRKDCPFVGGRCVKKLHGGEISGACTLKPVAEGPVICCPVRLYAGNYEALHDVAHIAFGRDVPMLPAGKIANQGRECVAVFGKGWGKELRLPARGKNKRGAYFVDWVLARLSAEGALVDFVAVEVQSIDTTGNYREERQAYLGGRSFTGRSTAGFNWENVNKRILPQIIYKGHVLRQEPLCQKGMFFVCPTPVYEKITERLGGHLSPYPLQPGTVTMMWYDVGRPAEAGKQRALVSGGQLTTTIDQVALAFTAPRNLPPPRVYENAIRAELRDR